METAQLQTGESRCNAPVVADEQISLAEATKLTPGRPSIACIWRWCRRGVVARNGERIRLEHVRLGSKLFTTRRWLQEFGRRLAESDAKYFGLRDGATEAAAGKSDPEPAGRRRRETLAQRRRHEIQDAERECAEMGI